MAGSAFVQAVDCQRCGHSYTDHRPACESGGRSVDRCACRGFRWVDPAPAPDSLGYHRPGQRP